MLTDIEIAQNAQIKPITEIAADLGIEADDLELYGKYKAKLDIWDKIKDKPNGKLVLVTAITPTPAGEGKTTTSVGLAQALCKLNKKAVVALREPSLGPVMGIKGGAAGGGYAQAVPMEDINLHFTGDLHAVTAANNLLSAMIDNHIHQGNSLNIDTERITFRRVLDINDRSLRKVVIGLGGKVNGVVREDGFMITVASEVMAILCLAEDIEDLKKRLSRIVVAYSKDGKMITAGDLKAEGAMTTLLKDAIKPNLVQTLENTPCLIHGGPFANIAHGCNSVTATKYALKLSDICITEAGFGADLGAEKFFDIKCRYAELKPDAAVLVATARALKYLGGVPKTDLSQENVDALKKGLCNLTKHIENLQTFGLPVIVAINRFGMDSDDELKEIENHCKGLRIKCAMSDVFASGGEGGKELAELLLSTLETEKSDFAPLYSQDLSIIEKITAIATKIYGAKGVSISPKVAKCIDEYEKAGYGNLPICMAKTQYSLSDNPSLLGRPENFEVTVREVKLSAGAGFIVVLTGDIMTMPGLPKSPAAEKIDIFKDGTICGLF